MDLRQLLMAGGTMQIVDVLGDEMAQDADALQLDHGIVPGIGLRLAITPERWRSAPSTVLPNNPWGQPRSAGNRPSAVRHVSSTGRLDRERVGCRSRPTPLHP